jgi:hypothetical protein
MKKDINYLLKHFEEEMEKFSISGTMFYTVANIKSSAPVTGAITTAPDIFPSPTTIVQSVNETIDKSKKLLPNSKKKNISNDLLQFTDEKGEFYNKILEICAKKGLDEVAVYKKAQLSRSIFSKIRSMDRTDYLPSKPTVICICLSLGLNLQETQLMLNYVGYSLSDKMLVDKIIAWSIEHKIFDIIDIDFCIYSKTGKPYLLPA